MRAKKNKIKDEYLISEINGRLLMNGHSMSPRCFWLIGTGIIVYLRRGAALLQNGFALGKVDVTTDPSATRWKVLIGLRRTTNGFPFLFWTVQIDVMLHCWKEELLLQARILHTIDDDFLLQSNYYCWFVDCNSSESVSKHLQVSLSKT